MHGRSVRTKRFHTLRFKESYNISEMFAPRVSMGPNWDRAGTDGLLRESPLVLTQVASGLEV